MTKERADTSSRAWLGPVLVAVLCAVIFLIDTLSPFYMAIAVLYVVVVLLAASFFGRRGLLVVGGVCIGLTALSFAIIHGRNYDLSAIMRCLVSIAAISVTTLLTLRNQKATRFLRDQADLLDLSHDAIFVRSPDDTITYWNRTAAQLYGWSREEAVGRKATSLLKTEFPCPIDQITAELFHTGQWEGELVHTTRDGRAIIALSRWSLQRDAWDRPAGTMETNRDITERKQAEAKLHRAEADLAHVTRVSTMGELTASITHEVNQPLAAIVTNGEACLRWLKRPVPELGEATTSVERMIANARRASDVVARLRALARRADPEHVPLDASGLIDDCAMLLERELSNHRVRLDLVLDRSLPQIKGDRVQLQQVLINLALNAIQAMDAVAENARVLRIATVLDDVPAPPAVAGDGPRAEGQGFEGPGLEGSNLKEPSSVGPGLAGPGLAVPSLAGPAERVLLITVEDTGPGVAPEVVPSLFAAFFTTKKDGIGIGLSISRSIVEAHGGRIVAAPGADSGMRFVVTLPVAREAVL